MLGIVAFTHREADVFSVYRKMFEKGWFTSLTTRPKALHLMLSPYHAEVIDVYLHDLQASLAQAGSETSEGFEARYS